MDLEVIPGANSGQAGGNTGYVGKSRQRYGAFYDIRGAMSISRDKTR